MEAEINEQPELLSRNSQRYRDELAVFEGMDFDAVVLVARGSSDNAALYARYLVEIHLGIPACLAAPSVWTRFGKSVRYPRSLVVGISQSGAAPDVAEVLDSLRSEGHATLGITNTVDSRLTEVADQSIYLGVGTESSVAATKTYTATLLALYQLVRALGAELPEPKLPSEDWLLMAASDTQVASRVITQSSVSFALGRGYAFGSAQEAALKLMECGLVPCKPFSLADFEHGPKALATHGTCALVFGRAPSDLGERGCQLLEASEPPCPQEIRPLWDAFTGQWLALNVARIKKVDPDSPPGLHKVTRTL